MSAGPTASPSASAAAPAGGGGEAAAPAIPPSDAPTLTFHPSSTRAPSTRLPSSSPSVSHAPTLTLVPSSSPSISPSTIGLLIQEQGFATMLFVSEERTMTSLERAMFVGIAESRTELIGLNISEPYIRTKCTILKQRLGTLNQTVPNSTEVMPTIALQVTYLMNWTSRYGYSDIENYPQYFHDYMVGAEAQVLTSLEDALAISPGERFVKNVGLTAHRNASNVVPDPTPAPAEVGTESSPTWEEEVAAAADLLEGATAAWRSAPSTTPSASVAPTGIFVSTNSGMRTGYLIGVMVAFSIVVLSVAARHILVRRSWKSERRREGEDPAGTAGGLKEGERSATAGAQDKLPSRKPSSSAGQRSVEAGGDVAVEVDVAPTAVPLNKCDAEASTLTTPETAKSTQRSSKGPKGSAVAIEQSFSNHVYASDRAQKGSFFPTIDSVISLGTARRPDEGGRGGAAAREDASPSPWRKDEGARGSGTVVDSNPLMAVQSESFSESDSLEETLSSQPSAGDELDRYRNRVLERLRSEVEGAIDGVDGMLSMAIARVILDGGGKRPDLSWIGGEDLGSIEASFLCRAFKWERKGDRKAMEPSDFFEDTLNKIVAIVQHGLVRPNDGARILRGCASVVGLPLIEEPPRTTIAIQGLIKSNELAQGHNMLVETFAPFGDIVDASIAPRNRGFGFVRFVEPKSVEEVLKRHQTLEIEIQDVAVSIRAL